MGKQDSINTIVYHWAEIKGKVHVWALEVHAVPVLLHFVIVLCLCECVCAEEGREKTRKEHLPLILCLAHFPCLTLNVGVIGKEEIIIVDCTQAGLYLPSVYIRGVRISCKECGYSYGTERTRVHYERERTVPLILYLAFVL